MVEKGITRNVFINGKKQRLELGINAISYARICQEAGKDVSSNPTVTYSLLDGRGCHLAAGQFAPLSKARFMKR